MRNAILLREIGGVFDACWSFGGRPSGFTAGRRAGLFNTTSLFVVTILPFIIALIAVVLLAKFIAPVLLVKHAATKLGLSGLAMGTLDVKGMIDQLNSTFVQFKNANDERIAALETKGSVDTLLVAKVERANTAITDMEAELTKVKNAMREIETANARYVQHGSPEAQRAENEHARQFLMLARGHNIEHVSDDDLTSYRAYKKALNVYFRKGQQALSDTQIRNALSTGATTSGGFWLTPDTSGRIVELVFQTSPIRQLASAQSIGTDTLEGYNDLDEASSGWVGETDARPETNTPLSQGKWQIPVYEQYANPKITQKMLDDSFFDVEGWLTRKVANKMSRVENAAFVNANGVNKPRGFLDYGATAITGKQSAATWKVLSYMKSGVNNAFPAANAGDSIIDLITMLKPEYRTGAAFGSTTRTVAAVRKLKDGQGNYLFFPSFLNGVAQPPATAALSSSGAATQGNLSPAGTLFGFPIYELADMPDFDAGLAFGLVFANWKEAYQIVDHNVGLRVLRDPFTGKPYISYYTTKRVGGDILNFEAAKILKFG
jgi:HK97 family phage major capsid protein